MKILYGSQNFGYDLPESDRDWMEVIFPTWDDIIHNRCVSATIKNTDGSQTKIRDIRKYVDYIKNGCISDFQTLWAKEYIDANDLKWFIDNRDRIVRYNLHKFYECNMGCIQTMLKNGYNPKDTTRIFVFYSIMYDMLNPNKKFSIEVPDSRDYRIWVSGMTEDKLKRETDSLVKGARMLEVEYSRLKGLVDNKLGEEMDLELKRLIQKNIK